MEDIDFKQKAKEADPTKRFPGAVKYDVYPGCKLVTFPDEGAFNKFFEEHNGCIISWLSVDASGRVSCLYTILLDEDEIEIMQIRTEELNKLVEERVEARLKQQAEEQERQAKEEQEKERLAVKGRKCEHDHGGFQSERERFGKLKKNIRKHLPKEQADQLLKAIEGNTEATSDAETTGG